MRLPLVTAGLALGTALVALGVRSLELRDLDVRGAPWRITSGPVPAGATVGQTFTAARDGLERIDVAAADVTDQPAEELELVLRADGPDGEELRRVHADQRAEGRRLYLAGDHLAGPWLEGAVSSGLRAADELIADTPA